MPRTLKGLALYLDGVPDSAGELFAPYAIGNLGREVPLKDDQDRTIGTAVAKKGSDGNVHVEATIPDSFSVERDSFFSIGAQVFDCDHRLPGIPGMNYDGPHLIRVNDADLTQITLGSKNPDKRVLPVWCTPHDGAGTEPEE